MIVDLSGTIVADSADSATMVFAILGALAFSIVDYKVGLIQREGNSH